MIKTVYFNELNLLMGSGGISYLPFVSGILSANAKKIPLIKKISNLSLLFLSQIKVRTL